MKGLGVGRMVHYVDGDKDCVAAIVTHVFDKTKGIVELAIFPYKPDISKILRMQIMYSEHPTPGTWHWPEFVE